MSLLALCHFLGLPTCNNTWCSRNSFFATSFFSLAVDDWDIALASHYELTPGIFQNVDECVYEGVKYLSTNSASIPRHLGLSTEDSACSLGVRDLSRKSRTTSLSRSFMRLMTQLEPILVL